MESPNTIESDESDDNKELSSIVRCITCNYPITELGSECVKCTDDEKKSNTKTNKFTNKQSNDKSNSVAKPSANDRQKQRINRGKSRGKARDKKQSQHKF